MLLLRMFLRSTNRRKDGKDHRYFSIVENRRLPGGKTAQRTVLYLGEINDRQQAAWRKTLEVFDEAEQRFTSLSLLGRQQIESAGAAEKQRRRDRFFHNPRRRRLAPSEHYLNDSQNSARHFLRIVGL